MLTRLAAVLRGLATRGRAAREADEELHFHIAQETEAGIARGLSRDQARREALRDLGGLPQVTEAVREVRTLRAEAIWQDFGVAVRRLRRDPGAAAVAIITLTLAVGANAAILSIADAVLFRPLPYASPERVFVLQVLDRQTGRRSTMTPYNFLDAIDAIDRDVSNVGTAESGPRVTVQTPDGPRDVPTVAVSPGYFTILGVRPAIGRVFAPSDAGGAGRVAMLSYPAWQQRFARDPGVIGRSTAIGDATFEIVGVLPREFVFPSLFAGKPEIVVEAPVRSPGAPGGTFHSVVRVAPGVSREQAQSEIDAAIAPEAARDPRWRGQTVVLDDVRAVLYGLVSAPIMRLLLASAVLTLFIGCANLANMLLVRGHRHRRDVALRLALGASRSRLVRPILLEAVLVGLVSAVAAVALAASFFDVLLRQVPPVAFGNAPVGVNWRVAAISLGLSLAGALVFAAAPAWRAAGIDVLALIQDRSGPAGRRPWLGRPLVVAQVALSLVAVFGALIAARAFTTALSTPLGFSAEGVVRIHVNQPRPRRADPPRVVSVAPGRVDVTDPPPPVESTTLFYGRVRDAIVNRPGVVAVGAVTSLPFSGNAPFTLAVLPGSSDRTGVGIDYVLPGYFETVEMSLRRGRLLTMEDLRSDSGAAVVSESAGRALFGGRDPLGEILLEGRTNRQLHVVGIIGDARQRLDQADSLRAYALPTGGPLTVVARVNERNEPMLAGLKSAVRTVAPASLVTADWWSDAIDETTAFRNPRFQTLVLGSLACLALALTALGVFGVLNHLVVSRMREMGVRVAIGASRPSIVGLVLMRALTPVLVGLGLGLFAVRAISPLAEAQLFQVNTHDPWTLAAAAAAVILAALLAAWLPARRASDADPLVILRSE